MKTSTLIVTTVIAVAGLTALGIGSSYAHGPFGGQGGPGYGMHQNGPGAGKHQGHGMMRQGNGPGMMQGNMDRGNCQYGQAATLATPLTVDAVRANFEQHLQSRGNDRLKVGAVTEQDDNTIIAEIVTVDDSLVRKIQIDKTTGRHTPIQ